MMKHKDYEPIKIELFQSDMEKIMWWITEANKIITHHHKTLKNEQDNGLLRMGSQIKEELQHKINIHRMRGEWF